MSKDPRILAMIERFNFSPHHIGYAELVKQLEAFGMEYFKSGMTHASEIAQRWHSNSQASFGWEAIRHAVLEERDTIQSGSLVCVECPFCHQMQNVVLIPSLVEIRCMRCVKWFSDPKIIQVAP